MARGERQKFKPVVVYDSMGFIRQLQIAAWADGEDVTLLMSDTTRYDVFTRDILLGQIGPGARYAISEKDPAAIALLFKDRALRHGATPEAIRLLGLLLPISKEEYEEMADKKLAPKKGDAEGLKAAAKKTPVGGAKAEKAEKPAGRKGNPEALAKAREASGAKQEAFKAENLTVLVKSKYSGLRGGRLAKLEFVEKAKPKKVGDVLGQTFEFEGKEITIDTGSLRGMEKRGHVAIG